MQHHELPDLDAFLLAFDQDDSFSYTKINHGFWEILADVEAEMGWPGNDEERARADERSMRPYFFQGGFVDDLIALLENAARDHPPSLHVCLGLSAWPGDNRIIGTPFRPERSRPFFERYAGQFRRLGNGLLLKQAVNDGTIVHLFERLCDYRVVLVGPEYLSPLLDLTGIGDGHLIPIHPSRARESRGKIEEQICVALDGTRVPTVVLLQAGSLAPYWLLRLHRRYPGVRWIDGGLAFSIVYPPDILKRPWGQIYHKEIVKTYNALGGSGYPGRRLFDGVVKAVEADAKSTPPLPTRVAFVEEKTPDLDRVRQLLEAPAGRNHWTNRGPLHRVLAQAFHEYFGLDSDRAVVPCANGGIALETLARLHDARAGKRHRWVVSSFSFQNLGRGYFSASEVVDCDAHGLLSIDDLTELPVDSYDGIVVTNPFGLRKDIDLYRDFADRHSKALLVDNAAGVRRSILSVDYQSLSLHHTKPFGVGEGGLAVLPAAQAEEFFELIDYRTLASDRADHWLTNGKLSDLACAFHLDRLERSPEWIPRYEMQAVRILHIARRAGFRPLFPIDGSPVATSLPFLADRPNPVSRLKNPNLALGKYYKPLAPTPNARAIYERIVNVPCHPDVARLDTEELTGTLVRINETDNRSPTKVPSKIGESRRWIHRAKSLIRRF